MAPFCNKEKEYFVNEVIMVIHQNSSSGAENERKKEY